MLQVLLVNTHQTAFKQGYNIMQNEKNRKNKDRNLRKLCMKYIKDSDYKDKGEKTI